MGAEPVMWKFTEGPMKMDLGNPRGNLSCLRGKVWRKGRAFRKKYKPPRGVKSKAKSCVGRNPTDGASGDVKKSRNERTDFLARRGKVSVGGDVKREGGLKVKQRPVISDFLEGGGKRR